MRSIVEVIDNWTSLDSLEEAEETSWKFRLYMA